MSKREIISRPLTLQTILPEFSALPRVCACVCMGARVLMRGDNLACGEKRQRNHILNV